MQLTDLCCGLIQTFKTLSLRSIQLSAALFRVMRTGALEGSFTECGALQDEAEIGETGVTLFI